MIPYSFDDLIYPYYPAYTMGCYQIVISHDNGRVRVDVLFLVSYGVIIAPTDKKGNATFQIQ